MELNNTIILPGDNPELSKKLLVSLVQKEDVVTIIIFGRDQKAQNAVQKADTRANAVVSGIRRKVAWMQDSGMIEFLKTLIKSGSEFNPTDISPNTHIGIAISMTDILNDLIPNDPSPDFIRMELAFIKASSID